MRAPSETRKWQRSCTCGSQAAFMSIVASLGKHSGHDRVLGAHHARLAEEDARPAQPRAAQLVAASDRNLGAERLEGVHVRVERTAADEVAARAGRAGRGRSAKAAARRAGTSRGCAPRAPRRPRCGGSRRPRTVTSLGPVQSASTPRSTIRASIVSTSRMRGTLSITTGSVVSRQAAMIGRAPFLLPATRTHPLSGRPPSMTNDSVTDSLVAILDTAAAMVAAQ